VTPQGRASPPSGWPGARRRGRSRVAPTGCAPRARRLSGCAPAVFSLLIGLLEFNGFRWQFDTANLKPLRHRGPGGPGLGQAEAVAPSEPRANSVLVMLLSHTVSTRCHFFFVNTTKVPVPTDRKKLAFIQSMLVLNSEQPSQIRQYHRANDCIAPFVTFENKERQKIDPKFYAFARGRTVGLSHSSLSEKTLYFKESDIKNEDVSKHSNLLPHKSLAQDDCLNSTSHPKLFASQYQQAWSVSCYKFQLGLINTREVCGEKALAGLLAMHL
jgi:hypothetical protein